MEVDLLKLFFFKRDQAKADKLLLRVGKVNCNYFMCIFKTNVTKLLLSLQMPQNLLRNVFLI